MAKATFAAGCFWGVEHRFRQLEGVSDAVSGYAGGTTANPTYKQVCSGRTGHAEAVQVTYDPAVISYETLVDHFFATHDPTQLNRQGPDVGTQYRSAIFTHDEAQLAAAKAARDRLAASGRFARPVVTEIVPLRSFFPAEEYHQRYVEKHGSHCAI
ncbi:MAG: peptide-methionine (S)-S-oxide reductase MsrA [Alphaproteobacteria bacterium]|nr:peptide-methionine (S)-S-oxide reductase MsrA [Alphaproteobacteria bacterium]